VLSLAPRADFFPDRRRAATPPAPRFEAPLAAGERPLDATTIEQLQRSIRALPGPVRDGFAVAFRRRFQIPAEVSSIADRIVQQCHHDWIEAFLVQQKPSADCTATVGQRGRQSR
jgi:hypothetical protein